MNRYCINLNRLRKMFLCTSSFWSVWKWYIFFQVNHGGWTSSQHSKGEDFSPRLFLLLIAFQSVFRQGSSSGSTSATKINIYKGCLFKRGGFPCLVKWQGNILLHFPLPFNYQPPIMAVPNIVCHLHTLANRLAGRPCAGYLLIRPSFSKSR